jgi:hypothetical protein
LARKTGSGRPKIKTLAEDIQIVEQVKSDHRFSTIKEIMHEIPSLKCSGRTVERQIHENLKMSKRRAMRKPWINDKNRKARVSWAKLYEDWSPDDWAKVLWSDVSAFQLNYAARRTVWRLPGEEYSPECMQGTVKHDQKVMVWGCFSAKGVGILHRIDGIMDQDVYCDILEGPMSDSVDLLFPEHGDCIFQQDNDPKHTAKSVKTWMKDNWVHLMPWPAQSPHLNPIENLWSHLDRRLSQRKCANKNELFEVLVEGWNALPVDYLKALVEIGRAHV